MGTERDILPADLREGIIDGDLVQARIPWNGWIREGIVHAIIGTQYYVSYTKGRPGGEFFRWEDLTLMEKVCTKWGTTGWHSGNYRHTYHARDAPNGLQWTWEQCAEKCAESAECEFWTLQLTHPGRCLMMSNQGSYHDDGNHAEGRKNSRCLPVSTGGRRLSVAGGDLPMMV